MTHPPSRTQLRRWRRNLAEERAEAAVYRDLAHQRSGDERDILLALADAERRHEHHWLELLGEHVGHPRRGTARSRMLGWLARRFGGVFVLALAQRAEARSTYSDDDDATATMAADERIHEEVVRALSAQGRQRLSGTFRAAVFGANDGLVSNLALILGIGASGASEHTVLLSGLAGLLAGALSMGAGEFVSIRSQRELLQATTPAPEATETIAHLDVDANELALVYRARGMSPDEAEAHAQAVLTSHAAGRPVGTATAHRDDLEAHGTPLGAAASSFGFFSIGAAIPVLPYLVGLSGIAAVLVAAVVVGIALSLTGAAVGLLSGTSPLTRALRQVAIGYGAAAATYLLGLLFGAAVG